MRKLNRLLMAALVLVPLAACDEGDDNIIETPDPVVGTVSGTVSVEGTGLAGVTVQLAGSSSQSTTTGSNGSFSFANVVEGNYSVTLSSIPGDVVFSNTTQSVSINTTGQTATADFNGQYVRTASILVTVTRADGSGVVTNVRLQGDDVDQTLGTNAQGNVTFSGLKSGDYTVTLPNPPAEGFDDTPTTQNVSVNTGQAVQVNFVGDTEIVPPEVSIERITSSATTLPVDPDSIVGRVDVTVQVEPNGNELNTIELWVLQKSTGTIWKIAEQRFASVAPEMQSGNDDTEVTFSWNSDAFRRKDGSHPSIKVLNTSTDMFDAIGADAMRPFHPVFINGDYEIHGRVTVTEFEEGFNAIVDVTLENRDAINLGVVADNTDWNNPTTGEPFPNFIIQGSTGLRWLSGDIYITVYPIIYSQVFDPNNPLLQRGNIAFDGFLNGADVGFGGAELTTPNADGTFTFTFCEAGGTTSTAGSACYASINDINTGLIGARNIVIQTKTAFGQFGPGFNAGAGVNNIKNIEFFNEDLQSGTGVLNDVLRIDNESPVPGSVNSYIDHPANAFIGVSGFSKTGLAAVPNSSTDVYLGWLKWDDPIDDRVQASPDDHPFVYPAVDKNGNPPTGGVWTGYDANASFAPGADLFGIGNPAGNPHLNYIAGPDVSASIA
ncbi:MAG: carboxypeptidase regulatory-like domain-containing protein, partial [Acidimicrobiia bacterium]|nr:carboxypeptidase regulatory-like domain-containing protein [Acidimicrobiia bacterium]